MVKASLLVFALCSASFAGTVSFTFDTSQMNDSASWSGLPLNVDSTISSGAGVTSANGDVVTVQPAGFNPPAGSQLYGLVQGANWFGDFPNGDALIYNGEYFSGVGTAIYLGFATPVSGLDLTFQADYSGDDYTMHLNAFDSGFNSLGGGSTNEGAGVENFGLLDTVAEISYVAVSITDTNQSGEGQNDFAVDTLFLRDSPVSPTPEPASFLLAGAALLSAGLRLRKRTAR